MKNYTDTGQKVIIPAEIYPGYEGDIDPTYWSEKTVQFNLLTDQAGNYHIEDEKLNEIYTPEEFNKLYGEWEEIGLSINTAIELYLEELGA